MIYLDNHATTRLDPRVLEHMLPYLRDDYANAGSVTHEFGRRIAADVAAAMEVIATSLGGQADELVVTSGATEALNLAIFGVCQHPRLKRRKIVAVKTEHRAVLDPLSRLETAGFEVVWLPVQRQGFADAGTVDLQAAYDSIDDQTALVCIMLVNNEIGVIQPLEQLSKICHEHGAILLCDGTAAVGRMAMDVQRLGLDLLAFSAHKFYGPKGVGGLYVNHQQRNLRLRAQILGGGQQGGLRSGTQNVPGIIGMSAALALCETDRRQDRLRIADLQRRLWNRLQHELGDRVVLNGPNVGELRAIENLNVQWRGVEGQALMLAEPEICISSGSACSAAEQTVSHVLTGIGLNFDEARCSTRIGLGRFTTEAEVEIAAARLIAAYQSLLQLN